MGAFRVRIELSDIEGERLEALDALVDTGATYTWVARSVLQELGYTPDEDREFILADGRRALYGLAWVPVRIDGRTRPTPVVFGEEGTEPLLGVVTLEEFGSGVDAVDRRLVPTPALLKALRRRHRTG
jgi:clan AA aspartic protease